MSKKYLEVRVEKNLNTVIKSHAFKVDDCYILDDVFSKTTQDSYKASNINVLVFGRGAEDKSWVDIREGLDADVELCTYLGYKQIRFIIQDIESNNDDSISKINAFDILMNTAKSLLLPLKKHENTREDLLFNELISIFEENRVGWTGGTHNTIGKKFIERLTTAIWYLDPHLDKLHNRACNLPFLFKQLKTYKQGRTYNEYYHTSKHKKQQLSKAGLESIIVALNLSLEQTWVTSSVWENVISSVFELVECIQKYATYLEEVNTEMNILHYNDTPARNGVENIELYTIEASKSPILSKYTELDKALQQENYYIYIDLDQYLPLLTNQKYVFIKELCLSFPISIYRYHHGNYLGTKNFIWRIPIHNDNRSETRNSSVVTAILNNIHKYYTRQMRKNMLDKVNYNIYNFIIFILQNNNLLFYLVFSNCRFNTCYYA